MTEPAYRPTLITPGNARGREVHDRIIRESRPVVTDTLKGQYLELYRILYPGGGPEGLSAEAFVRQKCGDQEPERAGVWVWYPWRNHLVHLPEEEDFITLRTSRNQYKITPAERDLLRGKTVAVAGLSVGNGIALTIAQERLAGEIRLADFDELELTNMNRIRASLCDLGLPKAVITARQIAETDPFIRIRLFPEGIREDNIRDFLEEGGPADLLVEVCDSLDIKIMLREACRTSGIPVVMDTSDRCMIDVERFDREKDRPLLHGLAGDLNTEKLRDLTNPQKIPYMLKMIGLETLSSRAKVSMLEIGQSIPTWPQLASTVTMGAGLSADVCRRILLGYDVDSGRYYADPEGLIPGGPRQGMPYQPQELPALSREDLHTLSEPFLLPAQGDPLPEAEALREMIRLAGMAPSSGNDQPWLFHCRQGQLFLFHERSRSHSFGDYRDLASQISLGSALENLWLAAQSMGWYPDILPFPGQEHRMVARIRFSRQGMVHPYPELVDQVPERHTNRRLEKPEALPEQELQQLQAAAESVPGARLQWTTDMEAMLRLGNIISVVDRIRIFHPQGHYDFFNREILWNDAQAREQGTGMWVGTLEIPPVFVKALEAVKDPQVIDTLRAIDGGRAFEAVTRQSAEAAAAMGFLTMPRFDRKDFLAGGMAGQRLWLMATRLGIGFHPLIAPLYLWPRVLHGNGEGLDEPIIKVLKSLRQEFSGIFETNDQSAEIYLFRIFRAKGTVIRPYRLPVEEIFTNEEPCLTK
jgi:nitroreductase